jgi:hypothetical protein
LGGSTLVLTKAEEHDNVILDQGDEAEFDPEELMGVGSALGDTLLMNFI